MGGGLLSVPLEKVQNMIRAQTKMFWFHVDVGRIDVSYLKGILEAMADYLNSRSLESFDDVDNNVDEERFSLGLYGCEFGTQADEAREVILDFLYSIKHEMVIGCEVESAMVECSRLGCDNNIDISLIE